MDDIRVFTEVYESVEDKQDVEEFNQIIGNLNKCIENDQSNFIELCYWFKRLKDYFTNPYANPKLYYGAVENKNGRWFYDDIIKAYGVEERTVNRMINIVNRFCTIEEKKDDVVPKIKPAFLGYTKSKLFELLPLSNSQIETAISNQRITSKSTVKAIRDYVKSLKTTDNKDNLVLEDHKAKLDEEEKSILDTYTPKKFYDYSYFESLSKDDLLRVIIALQREHFKNNKDFIAKYGMKEDKEDE